MTDILPPAGWPNVRQLETNEFATGGANGNMNEQAKSLAARSELLKQYAALPYESKTGGYALNERVQLATGDVVRSTIASNVNNPNENMTGWVKTNDASQIISASGETQQEINDFGGAEWYAKAGGYDLGATVKLANGDIVKSVVNNNTVNPNVAMANWVKVNSYIFVDFFGAKGYPDNDTIVFQQAIDYCVENKFGTLNLSAKTYCVETLDLKGVRIVGSGTIPYLGYVNYSKPLANYDGEFTVLQNPSGKNNIPVFTTTKVSLSNLGIRTDGVPTSARKLYTTPKSHCHFDAVTFEGLAGLGSNDSESWGGWKMHSCQTIATQGDVFFGVIVDMVVTSSTFTSTNGSVFRPRTGSGFNVFSSNRFEYTSGNHIEDYRSRPNSYVNNIFDRSYRHGAQLTECASHTWSGNVWWRNGYAGTDVFTDSHISVQNSESQDFSQDTFLKGKNDTGEIANTPLHLARTIGQQSTLTFPTLTRSMAEGTLFASTSITPCISTNAIDLKDDPVAGLDTDDFAGYLASINPFLRRRTEALVNQGRKVNSYSAAASILLRSMTSVNQTVTLGAGSFLCAGYDKITMGAVTYTYENGVQYVSSKPNGYPSNGVFNLGTLIQLKTPVVGENAWICFSKGSPDVWKPTLTLT